MKWVSFFLLLFLAIPAESLTVYGHRGARGLAPENTLPSFKEALKYRVDVIDLDVVMTEDGVLVAYHDLTLNPDITRDAKGEWIEDTEVIVKNLPLKVLQTYDVGRIRANTKYAEIYRSQRGFDHVHIPTLKEAIRYIKSEADYPVGFQVELKTDPTQPSHSVLPEKMVLALNQVLEEEGIAYRTKVQAFDWRCLLTLQRINPVVKTAYLTDSTSVAMLEDKDPAIAGLWTGGYLLKDYHDSIPEMIYALGGSWWDAEDVDITPEKLDEAHQLGLKVAVWSWPEHSTLQDVDVILSRRLFEMAVDGMITDRPDVIMSLLKPILPVTLR